ncbi:MAG: hypothetical protein Q8O03_05450 [Nanoarchaeota archaeon]|nr:hypothetical protein [Nanoarchaeota archaeon]
MTSVKQKIAGIEKERGEIQAGVRKIGSSVAKLKSDIRGQAKINAEAAQEMGTGIQKLQGAIRDLGKVNAAAAREIASGAKKLRDKTRQFEEEIAKKSNEMRHYTRDFYFGEDKK